MPNALFITGNKRSGTSQLVRLLNLHSKIYISHESDVMWMLYRFFRGEPFSAFATDSRRGMDYTLELCGHLLDRTKSPAENFFTVQNYLMEKGSPWLPPMEKRNLEWVGDKKPFQYSDPAVTDFIRSNFPHAAFVHLVRHPFAVAESARKFNQTADGDFWKGLSPEDSVEEWARNERNVLKLKESGWAKVIDVRYEDLCRQTDRELKRIFTFLGLQASANILQQAAKATRYELKKNPSISCSPQVRAIMDLYGYEPEQAQKGWAEIFLTNVYWKLRKKII